MIHVFFYDTWLGRIGIADNGSAITEVFFDDGSMPAGATRQETPLIKQAGAQLDEYFRGARETFDLPLAPVGTAFQQAVWRVLQTIPYGKTMHYQAVAALVGNPKASRAVGMANNRNPISIIIPCHRVIGKNGALVGYGGGLAIKEKLLALEQRHNNTPAQD